MVYFIKSAVSVETYHGWTCGGALITELHILTSAACLTDVGFVYAIAGYRRYVPTELLDVDDCTSTKKKRVVKTCVPEAYRLEFANASTWATTNDIGIAVVESPYNFSDTSYSIYCSYTPRPIAVNFRLQSTTMGRDVVALGWGYTDGLRMPYHLMDHNEEFLREASMLIANYKLCENKFHSTAMHVDKDIIDFYKLICTYGAGNIDSEGNVIDYGELATECMDDETTTGTETVLPDTTTKPVLRHLTRGLNLYPKLEPRPELKPHPDPLKWSERDSATEAYLEPETMPWPEQDKGAKTRSKQYDYYDYITKGLQHDTFTDEPVLHATIISEKVNPDKLTDYEEKKYDYEENKYGNVENKYDNVENKYDNLENQYDNVENKYDNVEHKYDNVENNYDNVKNKYDNVENKYDNVENKYDNMENKYDYDYEDLTRRFNRKRKRKITKTTKTNAAKSLRCGRLKKDLYMNTRRQSICQNDHGCPLITWIGTEEVLIGIALTSLYDKAYHCIPPNLYVSTVQHPWFIKCVVATKDIKTIDHDNDDNENVLRSKCYESNSNNKKHNIYEKDIKWPVPKKED
ncbi:uncharacterized protein LOC113232599 [Hyposmocoma kahamanoa]|uniref:uncharacterized protein LOC113232599 n=1 Tax=Hyposmocoma kahamanoa TaxID=1477025 RepID=UPI000E6D8B61|nr:uncharacterized protein LOC113232599 [Hyposmocoma kahamanoa]